MSEQKYTEFELRIQLQDPVVRRHAWRAAEAYKCNAPDSVEAIRQNFAMICSDDPASMAAFGQLCGEFSAGA